MLITPYLSGRVFEPETMKALSDVFTRTLERLRLAKREDPATHIVAEKMNWRRAVCASPRRFSSARCRRSISPPSHLSRPYGSGG